MADEREELEELLNEEGAELDIEEEEAAFEAAFSNQDEEYEPVPEEQEEVEESKADDTEKSFKEQLAEQQRLFEEKQRAFEDHARILEERLRKQEGKYGELNSKLKSINEERVRPGFPTNEEIKAALQSQDALDELKDRHPAWAEEVEANEALAQSRLGIEKYLTKDDIGDVVRAEALQGFVSKDDFNAIMEGVEERVVLRAKHPDWKQTVNSEPFINWIKVQGEEELKLFNSESSADAIKLLDIYKSKDAQKSSNEDRLRAAAPATTRSRSTPVPRDASEEEDFKAGFYGNRR